jgi:uncharacterized membrane protein YccC
MEGIAVPVQALEDANRKLDLLLKVLQPARDACPIRAEHMAAVLAEVLRVGEWLRAGLANRKDGRIPAELDQYRRHLEQLRQLLPGVHAQLLTERSRLEAERSHLESAAAWARSASSR